MFRAIPVPDQTVPLADILEFKAKRADELFILREAIDGMASQIAASETPGKELAKQVATLDQNCADVLTVAKEWPFPIRLANVKASLDLRPTTTLAAIGAAYLDPIGMPLTSAVLAGVGASIKIAGDFGLARRTQRIGPYRYVYSFTKELFL